MEIKELLNNPNTAPFSRIKYVRELSEEEIVQFLNGLFLQTVESKDSGDWEALSSYLEQWEAKLMLPRAQRYIAKPYESIPWASLRKPIGESRVALLTTGGLYVEGQPPFNVGPEGDISFREIPIDTPLQDFRVIHRAYDTSGPKEDVGCIYPIQQLKQMVREGLVGEIAPMNFAFMGYIPKPEELMRETAPQVAQLLKEAHVDAVVIGST